MLPLNTILCPVDLTPHSGKAMRVAMELAQHFKPAVVHCMNVVVPNISIEETGEEQNSISAGATTKGEQERLNELVRNAQSDLNDFIEKYILPEVKCVPHILVGNPTGVIVDYADIHPVDLIVMATHGREGLTHFFVGSVAEKVVQQSKAPVLTIRPDKE